MEDFEKLYREIAGQEQLLQFTEFTSDTALAIGMSLVKRAQQEGKAIAIDVTRHGQRLFHFAFDGTSPDNDVWIEGKNRLVNRTNRSSLEFELRVRQSGKSIAELFNAEVGVYLAGGGAFPITVKKVGVVGTITVSGLTGAEDHAWVVGAVRAHLGL